MLAYSVGRDLQSSLFEGKIEEQIEVTERPGRRRKRLPSRNGKIFEVEFGDTRWQSLENSLWKVYETVAKETT